MQKGNFVKSIGVDSWNLELVVFSQFPWWVWSLSQRINIIMGILILHLKAG